jgi:FKBP12-rapamycin complex-associated protein
MKRNKFPERVPFRLTRMLIKALEVSGIEGTFRITCENVMKVLRGNKDSLIAIFASFIHDPLVSFRIMIPMIMKKNKLKANVENSKRRKEEFLKKNNDNLKNINIRFKGDSDNNNINNSNLNFIDKGDNYGNEDSNIVIDEEEEKKERKKMENDERQMLNLFEERDDIESEELNKIAKLVLDRIKDKLSGTDFNKNIIYDYKMQVDKLIIQATFHENLAQSYLGWCPFW